MSSRETPWFGEVTNRTLRVEDSEAAARRELQKINQRRIQQGEPTLAWAPFYYEWKKTHPVDGFSNMDTKIANAMLEYR